MTEPLRLTVGLGPYDHTRDVITGAVSDARVDLRIVEGPPETTFRRVEQDDAFDVAEFSLAKYVAWRDSGRRDRLALPIFPSRALRQSSIYVAGRSTLNEASALEGRRVGVPEWVQTAGVWTRGWLSDHVGVPMTSIHWHQGGVDGTGRRETVVFAAPPGVRLTRIVDRPLDELLLSGQLDAVVSARPPASFRSGRTRRLVANWAEVETRYVVETGLFPIMHVLVVRRDLAVAHPWLTGALVDVFDEARRRSVARMADHTVSHAPVPWLAHHHESTRQVFGDDPFAYGLTAATMNTLVVFIAHCRAQGIVTGSLEVGDLFRP
jgi:4,5-dihydroxyphthalate decarboxylase